jgi:hypothetical protein
MTSPIWPPFCLDVCYEEISKGGGSQMIKDKQRVKYLGYTCWKKNGNGNLLADFGMNFIHVCQVLSNFIQSIEITHNFC